MLQQCESGQIDCGSHREELKSIFHPNSSRTWRKSNFNNLRCNSGNWFWARVSLRKLKSKMHTFPKCSPHARCWSSFLLKVFQGTSAPTQASMNFIWERGSAVQSSVARLWIIWVAIIHFSVGLCSVGVWRVYCWKRIEGAWVEQRPSRIFNQRFPFFSLHASSLHEKTPGHTWMYSSKITLTSWKPKSLTR